MNTQPRMSAPIGRLRVRTSKARKRNASGTGRWRPADCPTDAEVTDGEEARNDDERPRFYPFALPAGDERDG